MGVKARLEGHSFDLDAVEHLFRTGDPQVAQDEDGYYLTSPSLDPHFRDSTRLQDTAMSLLNQVNGAARVHDAGFRPVRLVGRYSDGTNAHHVVVVADTAEARDHVFAAALVVNGAPAPEQPPQGPKYLDVAKREPDAAEVLRILGKDIAALSWFDLYKVYEIVRDNVGGNKNTLVQNGWITQSELLGFVNSSNTASISRDDARHARGTPQSADTMDVTQARDVISRLVRHWFDSL